MFPDTAWVFLVTDVYRLCVEDQTNLSRVGFVVPCKRIRVLQKDYMNHNCPVENNLQFGLLRSTAIA